MQNLVLLMDPSEEANRIDLKGGNMFMNRFSIDEDVAFELSGVYYLKKSSYDIIYEKNLELERKTKGKGYLS